MAKEKGLVKTSDLSIQVAQETEKRQILAKYVKDNMVQGTDFYTLKIGGRETKPSLSKPGSEKVLSLFHWRAEFAKDSETWEMLGHPNGVLCYTCKIFTVKDGMLVGEGRGARDVKKDGGDVNKAMKMAQKSAQIDAVLRTGGLSDLFTQDIEDMAQEEPKVLAYKVERVEPVIQTEEPDITKKKKMIIQRLLTLDPLMDVKNLKVVTLEIASRVKLDLKEENFDLIIERLDILADDAREARAQLSKEE